MLLHPDKRQFLHKCLDILEKFGIPGQVIILGQELDGISYEDNLIFIQKSNDDRWMHMVRKTNNFPFYFMQNGTTILFHGEYIYLEDHIDKLLRV